MRETRTSGSVGAPGPKSRGHPTGTEPALEGQALCGLVDGRSLQPSKRRRPSIKSTAPPARSAEPSLEPHGSRSAFEQVMGVAGAFGGREAAALTLGNDLVRVERVRADAASSAVRR